MKFLREYRHRRRVDAILMDYAEFAQRMSSIRTQASIPSARAACASALLELHKIAASQGCPKASEYALRAAERLAP